MAMGRSNTAASATRDQATKAGAMPASTAILMNKYGTPQITEQSTKSAHARGVMPCFKRRRSESNRRIEVLQTSALPLGYGAGRQKLTKRDCSIKSAAREIGRASCRERVKSYEVGWTS